MDNDTLQMLADAIEDALSLLDDVRVTGVVQLQLAAVHDALERARRLTDDTTYTG